MIARRSFWFLPHAAILTVATACVNYGGQLQPKANHLHNRTRVAKVGFRSLRSETSWAEGVVPSAALYRPRMNRLGVFQDVTIRLIAERLLSLPAGGPDDGDEQMTKEALAATQNMAIIVQRRAVSAIGLSPSL